MALLLDTGAVYAGADEEDAWHGRMQAFLQSAREKILLPSTVVTESCFVLRARLGPRAEQAFLMSVAQGEAELVPFEPEDAQRTAELLRQYETARLDFVDASVVAIEARDPTTSGHSFRVGSGPGLLRQAVNLALQLCNRRVRASLSVRLARSSSISTGNVTVCQPSLTAHSSLSSHFPSRGSIAKR